MTTDRLEETPPTALSAADARRLTDEIRGNLAVAWGRLTEAFACRAWVALGYASWEAYCTEEFSGERMVRLAQPQRAEITAQLRGAGMSTRAIGSALGISKDTVARDLSTVSNETVEPPARVQSLDGRSRPAAQPPRPASAPEIIEAELVEAEVIEDEPPARQAPRRPLVDTWRDTAFDIHRLAKRLDRLGEDDRFARNTQQLSLVSRYELTKTVELLSKALESLSTQEG